MPVAEGTGKGVPGDTGMTTRAIILLLGDTGRTGRRVLERPFDRGFIVRARMRSQKKLPAHLAEGAVGQRTGHVRTAGRPRPAWDKV